MSDGDAALEALRAAGVAQGPQQGAAASDELRNARLVRAMPDSGVQKMIALLATLLDAARDQPHPEVALCRVLRVVQAIAGRSTYLSLLPDNAQPRVSLLRLCAACPWLPAFLAPRSEERRAGNE